MKSGSSSTSRSSTSSFVVVPEIGKGDGAGNQAVALPIIGDNDAATTIPYPKSWPKPPEKNDRMDTLDEAALDDTAD